MITGGWEPISLSSINRLVYIASTGHGPVQLSISSATHRIELTIFLTIMDHLPPRRHRRRSGRSFDGDRCRPDRKRWRHVRDGHRLVSRRDGACAARTPLDASRRPRQRSGRNFDGVRCRPGRTRWRHVRGCTRIASRGGAPPRGATCGRSRSPCCCCCRYYYSYYYWRRRRRTPTTTTTPRRRHHHHHGYRRRRLRRR